MNTKAVIPLVAGLGIAGVAAKLGLDYVRKAQARPSEKVQLWSAKENIPRGTAIREEMLDAMAFPPDLVPAGSFNDKSKLIGRVPHTGAPAGLPILETMLLAPGAKAGIFVPDGLRAVAVKVDEGSGVDNHLDPGCHVDVVGYFQLMRDGGKKETIARTLLEDVEVAAVGARYAPVVPETTTNNNGKSNAAAAEDKPVRAVTLLVPPEEVPRLHLAEQNGRIKLSMRNDHDTNHREKPMSPQERELLGLNVDLPKTEGPGWMDKMGKLFGAAAAAQKSAAQVPAPTPQVTPAEPPAPHYEWVMHIYNGSEHRKLGWSTLSSREPVQIGAEGPNIFEDPKERKTSKPADEPPAKEPDPPILEHSPQELFK